MADGAVIEPKMMLGENGKEVRPMNGMHGIIFSYDKENGLRELIENRVHGSIPFGRMTTASSTSSSPAW